MRFRERMARFMYGRYGMDSLNQFLSYVILALIIINLFAGLGIVSIIELVLLIIWVYRMLSKNIGKRQQENNTFCMYKNKVTGWFRKQKSIMSQRKDYHIYSCPNCRQKIRIPKGKGKIEISCPKCRTRFIKKS